MEGETRQALGMPEPGEEQPDAPEADAPEAKAREAVAAATGARKPAKRREVIRLIDTMRAMPKPFVMHCKSGADRAGFAAVVYLVVIEGEPLEEALRHLSLRYIHFDWTETGIVDHIFEIYQQRNALSPIGLEEWFRTEYTRKQAAASFRLRQAGKDWQSRIRLPAPDQPPEPRA